MGSDRVLLFVQQALVLASRSLPSADSSGTVTITDSDGRQRFFQPDGQGGYFPEPGDCCTLLSDGGGRFTLQEKDGSITDFGPDGRVTDVKDTNGNIVSAVYGSGLLIGLDASTGQSLTFTYNAAGRITAVTDSTGRTTTYTYDASNQYLLSVTDFTGRTTTYTYDTSGAPATRNALLSAQNPDGTIDNFGYGGQGRLSETFMTNATMAGTEMTPVTYANGPFGDVSATDANGGTTHYSFDNRGLLVKVQDPLGNATHYFYDTRFNLVQVIDAAGQVTTNTYDQNDNLIRTTSPDGSSIAFAYSGPFNRLTSYTDPDNNTTRYGYDDHGNQVSITYADNSEEQFSYDPLGDLTDTINRRGQGIHDTYNSMGQLVREDFADGTDNEYAYDSHGNMISATDSSGTTTFRYDLVTEDLLEVAYPTGLSLTFTYDSAGRRIQSVDQDGFTVKYLYNEMGLLAGLTDGQGDPIVTYAYDAAGRLIRKDMGNGTFTTYDYDRAGNLLHLINYAPDQSLNSRFDYTYDNLDRRTSEKTLDGAWTYQYDPVGQLTHAVFTSSNPSAVPDEDLSYVYDPAGNRVETVINGVTTQYVTNDLNQYTQVGSTSYSYDADGNLISQTDGGATTTLTYDELNRLTGVASPTTSTSYQYDPLGHLAAASQNGQTTSYLVDPTGLGNVVGAYRGSGSPIANYTYGLGLTSMVVPGDQASYFDFDAIGSTVGLTGPTGSYQNIYRYQPFGQTLTSAETVLNPFQFVGQSGVMAQVNGLEFMRARFYSSSEGRFLSPDPMGLAGGSSVLYAYVNNKPVDRTDANGLDGLSFYGKPIEPDLGNCLASVGGNPCGHRRRSRAGVSHGWSCRDIFAGAVAGGAATGVGVLGTLSFCFDHRPPPPKPPSPPARPCPVAMNDQDPGTEDVPCPDTPHSRDPNDKTGPAGYGPEGFITGDAALPYRDRL